MGVIFLFGQKIWPILGYFWGGTPKNAQKPPKMAKMRAKTLKNGSTLSSKMHFSLRSTLYIRVGVLCAQCNETSLMSPCNGAYFYAKYVQKRVDAVI